MNGREAIRAGSEVTEGRATDQLDLNLFWKPEQASGVTRGALAHTSFSLLFYCASILLTSISMPPSHFAKRLYSAEKMTKKMNPTIAMTIGIAA